MKAEKFFKQEWGTGFTKATLSEKNGILYLSMEDIYSTMERYAELRLSDFKRKRKDLSNINLKKAIAKAKPNMDKIKDVDKHLDNIR